MIYSSVEEALLALGPGVDSNEELLPIQQDQYTFHEEQVAEYGQYNQGIDAYGAHYGALSPFAGEGLVCANCVYYANNACEIVQGNIAPGGICKFWIIPESKLGD
ncbi:hypothetical protein UFOVP635_34 [uncultured Caudovirales phage]|uniref:High potential iron-sulfur proteins family profile domain-containing protein n=1 Tax=uncultured Caudovirales phage TaxID=2100421 RepID=A0A6J5N432_9CAUD|nr:hypothetical protein UFOVP635_34 [uncultured Caudovirales phage]